MADLEKQLQLALRRVRELRLENEELKRALNQTKHSVTFDENGFATEHLVECRSYALMKCPVHVALSALPGSPVGYGTFPVELDEDGELIFTVPEDAAVLGTPV